MSEFLSKIGFNEALECQRKIKNLGGESRILGNGGADFDLNDFYYASLLVAINPNGRNVEDITARLNGYERQLGSQFGRDGVKPRILTLIDFDGVLVSLTRTARRAGYANLRCLAETARSSDLTIVWTSRFYLSELRGIFKSFQGRISYFPFLDQTSVTNLERLGGGKLMQAKKHFFSPERQLWEFIGKTHPDLTYYVGSSGRDRNAMIGLLKNHPETADRIVFFDAAHVFL